MPRWKNFVNSKKMGATLDEKAHERLRWAAFVTGMDTGVILTKLIDQHLDRLIEEEGHQGTVPLLPLPAPSPKPSKPQGQQGKPLIPKEHTVPTPKPKPQREPSPGGGSAARDRATRKFEQEALDAVNQGSIVWDPPSVLEAALAAVGMTKDQLGAILGHSNPHVWFGRNRGKEPRIPPRYWVKITELLRDKGFNDK